MLSFLIFYWVWCINEACSQEVRCFFQQVLIFLPKFWPWIKARVRPSHLRKTATEARQSIAASPPPPPFWKSVPPHVQQVWEAQFSHRWVTAVAFLWPGSHLCPRAVVLPALPPHTHLFSRLCTSALCTPAHLPEYSVPVLGSSSVACSCLSAFPSLTWLHHSVGCFYFVPKSLRCRWVYSGLGSICSVGYCWLLICYFD